MVLSADILFVSLLYFLVVSVVSAPADQREIKAKSGDDVILQCRGPADASIVLLEWNRPDLSNESYVFFYRNERPYENYQLPSFRGRVELRDPEMKNRDASVILKNVTVNDTGTYECLRVTINTSELNKIKHAISLTVTDSDDTAGNRDGGNRDGGNRDGGNRDGGNRDGGNKDGGNKDWYLGVICASSVMGVLLLVAIVSLAVMMYRRHSNTHSVIKRINKHDVVI